MINTKLMKIMILTTTMLSISLYMPAFAQTQNGNQDLSKELNLGSFTPIVGYKTESGGKIGMFKHVMFDSNSMQMLEVNSNIPPVFNVVSNSTLNKFIDIIMNSNFFTIESPEPSNCQDCFDYLITISVPTSQGTMSNTVIFDSLFNFPEKQDAELMLQLLDIMNNIDNPYLS
ncbi:MAG: hypothetical protein ACPKPY_00240 [Nitrososphaeraceae archaeon]